MLYHPKISRNLGSLVTKQDFSKQDLKRVTPRRHHFCSTMERSTRSQPNLFQLPDIPAPDEPAAVTKTRTGGRGGRMFSGHVERKSSERYDNTEWVLHPEEHTPDCHTSPPPIVQDSPQSMILDTPSFPVCPPCKDISSAFPDEIPETILLNADQLKQNLEEHFACKHCVKSGTFHTIHGFIQWADMKRTQMIQEALANPPEELF